MLTLTSAVMGPDYQIIRLPENRHGQFLSTSSISGTVTDDTGSVLPGVSVSVTSPALQVTRIRTVTDAAGRYQFADLPAGVYPTYGESNFQMIVDGINLLTGTFPDQVTAQEIEVRTFGSGAHKGDDAG